MIYTGIGDNVCEDMIMNVSLRDKGIFNMYCNGIDSCRNIHGIIVSGSGWVSNNSAGDIVCLDSQSCIDMSIVGIGLNEFNLYCNGDSACKNGLITSTSFNGAQNGTNLNVNCYNGDYVCRKLEMNALSIKNVNVTCHINDFGNECSGIQVI